MPTLSEVKVPAKKAPKTSPTPKHEIEVTHKSLQGSYYPFPDMEVGETVRFFSKEGEVTIHLTGASPFRTDRKIGTQVPGGVILTLVQESEGEGFRNGTFHIGCSLTLRDGTVVGWPELPGAGGDPHIKQP